MKNQSSSPCHRHKSVYYSEDDYVFSDDDDYDDDDNNNDDDDEDNDNTNNTITNKNNKNKNNEQYRFRDNATNSLTHSHGRSSPLTHKKIQKMTHVNINPQSQSYYHDYNDYYSSLLSKRLYSDAALTLLVGSQSKRIKIDNHDDVIASLSFPPVIPLPNRRLIGSVYHDQIVPTLLNQLQQQNQRPCLNHSTPLLTTTNAISTAGTGTAATTTTATGTTTTTTTGEHETKSPKKKEALKESITENTAIQQHEGGPLIPTTVNRNDTINDPSISISYSSQIKSPNRSSTALFSSASSLNYSYWVDKLRVCNCKRSHCLKLYCDCFAAGVYCHFYNLNPNQNSMDNASGGIIIQPTTAATTTTTHGSTTLFPSCGCTCCKNVPFPTSTTTATTTTTSKESQDIPIMDPEKERREAMLIILERNPHAFRPRAQVLTTYNTIGPWTSTGSDVVGTTGGSSSNYSTTPYGIYRSSSSQQQVPFIPNRMIHPTDIMTFPTPSLQNTTTTTIIQQPSSTSSQIIPRTKIHGCHCKKSSCLKKYCECFQAFMCCNKQLCKCMDCKNYEGNLVREEILKRKGMIQSMNSNSVPSSSSSMPQKRNHMETQDMDVKTQTQGRGISLQPQKSNGIDSNTTGPKGISNSLMDDPLLSPPQPSIVYIQQSIPSYSTKTDPSSILFSMISTAVKSSSTSRPHRSLESKIHIETDPFLPPSTFTIPATHGILEFGKSSLQNQSIEESQLLPRHPLPSSSSASALASSTGLKQKKKMVMITNKKALISNTNQENKWILAKDRLEGHIQDIKHLLHQEGMKYSGVNKLKEGSQIEMAPSYESTVINNHVMEPSPPISTFARAMIDGISRDIIQVQNVMKGTEQRIRTFLRISKKERNYNKEEEEEEVKEMNSVIDNDLYDLTCTETMPWNKNHSPLSSEVEDEVVIAAQENALLFEMAKIIRRKAFQLARERNGWKGM